MSGVGGTARDSTTSGGPYSPTARSNFDGRFAVGGEFEMEMLGFSDPKILEELTYGLPGTWVASGRAALHRILRKLQGQGVRHVHLPAYLCESVLQAVKARGMEFSFYPVDAELVAHPDPPKGSVVLLIHYFGRINEAAHKLRTEAGNSFWLIEDACQALLSDWRGPNDEHVHYLLSPRKFGPAPLGGWSNVLEDIEDDPDTEDLAYRSLAARLVKGAYRKDLSDDVDPTIESFYLNAFAVVEGEFDAIDPNSALPSWVAKLIASINWRQAARVRLENQQVLRNTLPDALVSPGGGIFKPGEVPLGHPIVVQRRDTLREELAIRRIFCPIHWKLPPEVGIGSFPLAHELAQGCLTLPVDQRYTTQHMEFVADCVARSL